MVRTNETVLREIYRIYSTQDEHERGLNATRIGNGIFRANCVDVAATNMTDLAELHEVVFRGWYEPNDSTEAYFRVYVVFLELGQFTYEQLRKGELMLSDLVNAEWSNVFEIVEIPLQDGEWA